MLIRRHGTKHFTLHLYIYFPAPLYQCDPAVPLAECLDSVLCWVRCFRWMQTLYRITLGKMIDELQSRLLAHVWKDKMPPAVPSLEQRVWAAPRRAESPCGLLTARCMRFSHFFNVTLCCSTIYCSFTFLDGLYLVILRSCTCTHIFILVLRSLLLFTDWLVIIMLITWYICCKPNFLVGDSRQRGIRKWRLDNLAEILTVWLEARWQIILIIRN